MRPKFFSTTSCRPVERCVVNCAILQRALMRGRYMVELVSLSLDLVSEDQSSKSSAPSKEKNSVEQSQEKTSSWLVPDVSQNSIDIDIELACITLMQILAYVPISWRMTAQLSGSGYSIETQHAEFGVCHSRSHDRDRKASLLLKPLWHGCCMILC